MDKSLKFFSTFLQQYNSVDNITGLPTDTVQTQINTTVTKDGSPFETKSINTQTYEYDVVKSIMSDNNYINYLGNSKVNTYDPAQINPDIESDIFLPEIIEWSRNHKAITLKPQHFLYLKNYNVYPANRIMVLRRFNGPIMNDLFKSSAIPKYTLVTYYDMEKPPVSITFKENWKKFNKPFSKVLEDVIGIKFDSIPGFKEASKVASSPLQDILNKIGQKLGFITEGGMPYGDPNIIYESATRDVDGEGEHTGLSSNIKIEFEATYVMNEINGINAKAAMLDIIATCIAMGTSPERFYVTGKGHKVLSKLMKDMANGDVGGLFTDILNTVKDELNVLIDVAKQKIDEFKTIAERDTKEAVDYVLGNLSNIAGSVLKTRYSRYRWQLIGAVGALTGVPTAPWHITIGNPKFPWFSCGNLYITSASLEPGGELGYNDMFTEITVKYTFESARPMGANGIASLFNSGKGRIYDTIDKLKKVVVNESANVQIEGKPNTVNNQSQVNTENNTISQNPLFLITQNETVNDNINITESDIALQQSISDVNITDLESGVLNNITNIDPTILV